MRRQTGASTIVSHLAGWHINNLVGWHIDPVHLPVHFAHDPDGPQPFGTPREQTKQMAPIYLGKSPTV
jgi:hypothetical protein